MPAVVVDTHAIVWYLDNDSRLSSAAESLLDRATAEGDVIHVPSVCLVELTYLIEKGRIPRAARERLVAALTIRQRLAGWPRSTVALRKRSSL